MLAEDQRGATAQTGEFVGLVHAHLEVIEQRRIELPGPAAFDGPQRLARDVVDHVRVLTGLLRDQPEPAERSVDVRVDARRTSALAFAFGASTPFGVILGRAHGEVRKDDAAEFRTHRNARFRVRRIRRSCGPRRTGVDRVPPRRTLPRLRSANAATRVAFAPAAVAVARQIERDDAKLIREKRRDEAPPFQMCVAAVDQCDAGTAACTPRSIRNRYAVNVDVARLGRDRRVLAGTRRVVGKDRLSENPSSV